MAHSESWGRLPDFIGVGPPRTATTWLHNALSGHVGLPSGTKETNFFADQYSKGLAWYAAHFRDCPPDRPMGEFSPTYFIRPEARERIARHIPHCKIICTLRDPVERVYSHYRKMCEGQYFVGSFEQCLEQRADILEWSRYAYHVAAWKHIFGAENVLVLIHDDLKTNPQEFLQRVCNFIQIPGIGLTDSSLPSQTINAIPSRPRNPRLARFATVVRDRLEKSGSYAVVNLLRHDGLRRFLFSGGPGFQALGPEIYSRLREMFLPEVEALEEMLQRDLSGWKGSGRQLARSSQ